MPRLYMNIVMHAFTLLFFYPLRTNEGENSLSKEYAYWGFGLLALVLEYAQKIPLSLIQNMVQNSYYPFDVAEKFLSFTFL